MDVRLVIPGKPVGYCTNNGRRYNTKRKTAYLQYKKLVQERASLVLCLPLEASRDKPLFIHTTSYFENGVHADPENVHKGVKDALFYGAVGVGDKYTGGSYSSPLYDKNRPRVEVRVTDERN